ncbi:MAG: GNAT family N-acetyltransferase [Caldilineaceae bacterium]|nr:GNAT family N-acetyltransferase [Caldilineaceae bacterium]HRJ45483.1 GNAT family N-acetyltransferase [Caldilineaceae bacterium]
MAVAIRQAYSEDIPELVEMINGFAARNLMLPRTPEAVMKTLPDWLVAVERDESGAELLLGCGSLVALTPELAEVRSLAVHERGQGKGVGSLVVENLVALAKAREFSQICALTLREEFFQRLGFEIVDRWSISPKLWQECIYCPKFHRCDEVAVIKHLTVRSREEAAAGRPAAANPLLKWQAWQPLKLAYSYKPIHLDEQ